MNIQLISSYAARPGDGGSTWSSSSPGCSPSARSASDSSAQRSRERQDHDRVHRRQRETGARVITTPLERVIASADGSTSSNHPAARASARSPCTEGELRHERGPAQIQSKVAQVRNDLPPEAEAHDHPAGDGGQPVRRGVPGFSSPDLDQNQITDYLTRVVQPK